MSDWDYPNAFCYSLQVGPEHIDGLGHVNNIVYTQWCQEIAWQHSAALGLAPGDYQTIRRAMAIVSAGYEYLAAAYIDEQLTMATWLTASDGRLKMERRFQLCRDRDSFSLFRGSWQLTCINLDSAKPARMPAEFLDAYEPAVVS